MTKFFRVPTKIWICAPVAACPPIGVVECGCCGYICRASKARKG